MLAEDVSALASLGEIVNRAPCDNLAPVADERLQHFLQREQLRLAVLQGDHVDAEHRLHRRLRVEVVQDDVRRLTALELDDDAHAVLVGLIAQLGNAFDFLCAHQIRDALQQARLVHLVRQLGDDDRLPIPAQILERGAGANRQPAAAGAIGRCDFLRAVDDAGRREIRTGNVLHQPGE
jgi:hypothetical protein